jgi:hypothetical protein
MLADELVWEKSFQIILDPPWRSNADTQPGERYFSSVEISSLDLNKDNPELPGLSEK